MPSGTSRSLTFYRVMAWVTGVVLATSCLFGFGFWPWALPPAAAGVLWTMHGWLYMVYLVAAFTLAYRRRWRALKTVLVLLAGTIPLMSFVAERRVSRAEAQAQHDAGVVAPAG